jgi:PAS domain S-box-containing protein
VTDPHRFRHAAAGYLWAVVGVTAVTAVFVPFNERISHTTVALALLLVVLFVAARWGSWPAFVASVLGMLAFNFFFLPPIYTLTIEDPRNWVALAAFMITAVTAGQLSERARRRAAEAEAGRDAARRANAYNRSLIEASLDGMAAIGPDGSITDVNAAAERLTGRSRAQLVGTDFSECFTDPDRARTGYRQAFREGVVRSSTLGIRRADGHVIPVLYNASVYRDEAGEVVGVFVVVREVVEPVTAGARPVAAPPFAPIAPLPPAAPERGIVTTGAQRLEPWRVVLALLPPVAALLLQLALWPFLRPFAWFSFYPAVFASAWVGGRRGGILGTVLSTLLASWFFVEPVHTLAKGQARYYVAAGAFAFTGALISMLQGRLQMVTQRATGALAEVRAGSEKLRAANDEILRLVEQASDGIFVADRHGLLSDVNRAGCHLLGHTRDELLGKSIEDLMPGEEGARLRRDREQLASGGVQIAEFRVRRKDGSLVPVEVSAKILPDGRWQGLMRDITERKRAENELRRTNRAHRALSSCNQALIRATDERQWLAEICRIVVEQAGYRFCWIGRGEHDEARTVKPVAEAGFDEGYLAAAGIRWADSERGRGPTGTAIREGRTVVAKDIATDPRLAPWQAEALRRGYASSIAIPLALDASTVGAMTIYAAEADAFGDQEVALLCELADDLAYGMATLRTRAERDRAQEELRTLNAELEQRVTSRTAELRAAQEREAETGNRIQQALLLDEPPRDVSGLRLAALTLPSQRVAGDFYGFFSHEDSECLDVLVADVMGKGVPAALLAAATKFHFPEALWHLLAGAARGVLPEPQDIVTLAHTRMARQLIGLESFVTACYARFDVARRRLQLVDCGHTGAIHLRPSTGSCSILHGDNLPLGVSEGEIYDQSEVPLEVDDVVMFFSDGVTEARNARGELFGTERLIECARRNAGSDPAALVGAVRDAAVDFAGRNTPTDDLTCVVVQFIAREVPLARADVEIRSALSELRRAREFVETFCAGRLGAGAVASLVLAVDEAISNIIKHAYRGREDQRIEIAATAFGDRISIRLRYLGASFDPSVVPPPSFDGSRESGFGVFLIGKSVDAVRYDRDDLGRSRIRLDKRRDV